MRERSGVMLQRGRSSGPSVSCSCAIPGKTDLNSEAVFDRYALVPLLSQSGCLPSFVEMRFLLTIGFLTAIIQCGCLPVDVYSKLSRGDDFMATGLTRVKKSADNDDYLEECAFVDSWREEPGFINVLAFLDASWQYSHRQATMLKMLQGRLQRSGMKGIRFFVINSAEPEAATNTTDMEDEKEAWGEVEAAEDQAILEIVQTREALKGEIGPEITFVQDTSKLRIWEKLSASRDQVLVIDMCGRLSYRVIVPWSILHFPYVKAAILSTYKEQPCGRCNLETTTVAYDEETQTEPISDLLPENFNIMQMKEIAVKKYNLDQSDNTVTKVYPGSTPQDIPDNVIQLLNGNASINQGKVRSDFQNNTDHEALVSKGDTSFYASNASNHSQNQLETKVDNDDKIHENITVIAETRNDENNMETRKNEDLVSTIIHESKNESESVTVQYIQEESSIAGDITMVEPMNMTILRNMGNSFEERENLYSIESEEMYINDNGSESDVSNSQSLLTDNNIGRTAPGSGEMYSNEHSQNADYAIPIRIIMHAPHYHEHEDIMKKHEYLVLKLNNPEYHGHIEYDEDVIPSHDNLASSQTERDDKNNNYTITEDNEEFDVEKGEVESDDGQTNHWHHGNGHHHNAGRKDNKGHPFDGVYEKNESPGFYGEDAEYWKKSGNLGYQENLQTEETSEKTELAKFTIKAAEESNLTEYNQENLTITEGTVIEETTQINDNFQTTIEYTETLEETNQGTKNVVDQQVSQDIIKEEEITSHLLQHYSKLIPWLDYVIDP